MEDKRDDLWSGGSWERPNQALPLPVVVRIPKQKQSSQHKPKPKWLHWAGFTAMLVLILSATIALGLASRSWNAPSPFGEPYFRQPDDYQDDETDEPPRLPQAAIGADVTVEISPLSERELSFPEIYEKNQYSVVTIHAVDRYGMSQGTGIVLTSDGYIITNAHVIAGARRASVVLSNDVTYEASLVGYNTDEDLAVLKVDAQDLIPAEFGDSFLLKVGENVCALGTPMGYRMTLTEGVISQVDRKITVEGTDMYLLQTSAPINFGNSGGALFNDRGQVVGVTTVKIVSNDGSVEALGFAIPSERVKYVVDHIIAGEEIKCPVLGITVQYYPGSTEGLEVTGLEPWSDAPAKGLQVGDRITTANGHPVEVYRDLERVKNLQRVGDELELGITRNGQEMEFVVRLIDPEMYED